MNYYGRFVILRSNRPGPRVKLNDYLAPEQRGNNSRRENNMRVPTTRFSPPRFARPTDGIAAHGENVSEDASDLNKIRE